MNYYVWYRVRSNTAATEAVIRGMMARLTTPSRLLKKRGEPTLWMEVYEDVADPEDFELQLADAVAEFGVAPLCEGERHGECFEDAAQASYVCVSATIT